MVVKTNRLGLAAYMKMKGCHLIELDDSKFFVFNSPVSLQEWEVEYSNSCCRQHDSEVCELRRLSSKK